MPVIGLEVVETARRYRGTPFQHQGRRIGLGIDCAGLLVGVAHDLGLSDWDMDGYPRIPDGKTMQAILRSEMVPIASDQIRPGDVLLFGFYQHAQHLAIITRVDPIYIIHAYQPNDEVVEHRLDSVWQRRVRGAYRFPGVHT